MKSSIKIFQLRDDYWVYFSGFRYRKGTIFVQWNSKNNNRHCKFKTWILATPTMSSKKGGYDFILDRMRSDSFLDEISIEDILYLKPHWHKELKRELERVCIMTKFSRK